MRRVDLSWINQGMARNITVSAGQANVGALVELMLNEAVEAIHIRVYDLPPASPSKREPWQSGTYADIGNINFPPGQETPEEGR